MACDATTDGTPTPAVICQVSFYPILGSPPEIASIRLVQLFGSYMTDVPVDERGAFQVRELECGGDYLLIAMERSRLRGTMIARARVLPTHIRIDPAP